MRALGQLEGWVLSSPAAQIFGREETLESSVLRCLFISKESCVSLQAHSGVGTACIPVEAASIMPPPARSSTKPLIFHWISALLFPPASSKDSSHRTHMQLQGWL